MSSASDEADEADTTQSTDDDGDTDMKTNEEDDTRAREAEQAALLFAKIRGYDPNAEKSCYWHPNIDGGRWDLAGARPQTTTTRTIADRRLAPCNYRDDAAIPFESFWKTPLDHSLLLLPPGTAVIPHT